MSVQVKDILALNTTKQFTPVAGTDGFFRTVEMVDMLDYAWERSEDNGLPLFDQNSFVLSSLLFARGNPEKLLTVIRSLIECGVSGLAYKPIFYRELPEEIRRLADSHRFPIFRIENGTNIDYREIIIDVTDTIRFDKNISAKETYFARMANDTLTPEDVMNLTLRISPAFAKNVVATLIYGIDDPLFSKEALMQRFAKIEELKNKCVLCKFDEGLILVMSHDSNRPDVFNRLFERVLAICGLDRAALWISYSEIHPSATMLNICVQEAKMTRIASLVLNQQELWFHQIGVLSCLIPLADNPHTGKYMKQFLNPILDNPEYMQTVIAFVRAEGNYEAASQMLNYHKNTLRYRLSKIQSWLAPDATYDFFYQNLSLSVKIYLIQTYLF